MKGNRVVMHSGTRRRDTDDLRSATSIHGKLRTSGVHLCSHLNTQRAFSHAVITLVHPLGSYCFLQNAKWPLELL